MLHFAERGSPTAPSLVFIHGMGFDHRMWAAQLEHLSHDYRVLAPDLPGFSSRLPSDLLPLKEAAGEVARWLDEVGAAPAHVCGLSLGGMVALHLAHDAPGSVRSLVLSGAQVRPPRALMIIQEALVRVLPERRLLQSSSPNFSPALQQAQLETLTHLGKRGLLRVMRDAGRSDLRPLLPETACPALVLCGSKDRPNLGAARTLAAGLPHAELRTVPNVGHVWNLKQPETFSQMVGEFVAGIES